MHIYQQQQINNSLNACDTQALIQELKIILKKKKQNKKQKKQQQLKTSKHQIFLPSCTLCSCRGEIEKMFI